MTTIEEYELRAKNWADDLPDFEQCIGGLHKEGDGYCCLGVASEISQLGFWAEGMADSDSDGDTLLYWVESEYEDDVERLSQVNPEGLDEIPRESGVMPVPVQEYYGLTTDHGAFEWHSLPTELRWKIIRHLVSQDRVTRDQQRFLLDREFAEGVPGQRVSSKDTDAAGTGSLVYMNDKRVPFELIADIIRARPRGLFTW